MIIIYTLLRANCYLFRQCSLRFLHSYIKIIIIEQLCTKKELYKLKSLKEEKKQMVHSNERDPISMDLGANMSFVVSICLMDLPRERNTMLEKEETLEEDRQRGRRASDIVIGTGTRREIV